MQTSDRQPQAPILAAFHPDEAGGREPVEFGIAASRITGAPLTIVHIRHGGPMVTQLAGSPDDSLGDDDRTIKHLRLDLERRRIDARIAVREARTVGGGLTEALKELRPQMIALGVSKRSAIGAALLGTTIERVIHEADCPVAVVPRGYRRPEQGVQMIGVAYTPTPEGSEALRAAVALATAASVGLRVISVLDPKHASEQTSGLLAEQHRDADPGAAEQARHRLADQLGVLEALQGAEAEIDILYNEPVEGLVGASRHVDLLLMGSRARGPRRATVLGSVSRKVAEESACPVLILPRGASETTSELLSHAGSSDA